MAVQGANERILNVLRETLRNSATTQEAVASIKESLCALTFSVAEIKDVVFACNPHRTDSTCDFHYADVIVVVGPDARRFEVGISKGRAGWEDSTVRVQDLPHYMIVIGKCSQTNGGIDSWSFYTYLREVTDCYGPYPTYRSAVDALKSAGWFSDFYNEPWIFLGGQVELGAEIREIPLPLKLRLPEELFVLGQTKKA